MRPQIAAFFTLVTSIALAGCGKGIDLKRDIVFDVKKPVVVWYEPLTSAQKVHPFFRSTGFFASVESQQLRDFRVVGAVAPHLVDLVAIRLALLE